MKPSGMKQSGTKQSVIRQSGIEKSVGIGARPPHMELLLSQKNEDIDWLEIHPENHMGQSSRIINELEGLAELYPLSLHSVGLSLISSEALDQTHLLALRRLIDDLNPILVSEHLAWSAWQGRFYNDLLPVPMSAEVLQIAIERVDEAQNHLGRQLLIENPSAYGALPESTMPEQIFLAELARATDCGLLLDINNVVVSARNLDFDPKTWLDDYPVSAIGEIHLAGHAIIQFEGEEVYIDDHASAPSPLVWTLADELLKRSGAKPILIEWDKDIPDFDILCAQARRAKALLEPYPIQAPPCFQDEPQSHAV